MNIRDANQRKFDRGFASLFLFTGQNFLTRPFSHKKILPKTGKQDIMHVDATDARTSVTGGS